MVSRRAQWCSRVVAVVIRQCACLEELLVADGFYVANWELLLRDGLSFFIVTHA